MMPRMPNPMAARKLRKLSTSGGPPIWRTEYWSATIWIIVITCVVSLIDMFSMGRLSQFGALSIDGIRHFYVWQLFTYQLLHAGPIHLLFNMLWLYMLGPIIEPLMGKRRFVSLYVLSGVVGGAIFLVTQEFAIGGVLEEAHLVGASASILGVMAGAVCVAPRMPIQFWFPPVSIPLWVIFIAAIVMAMLAIRVSGMNAGGEAAHLGGAAAGLIGFTFRSKLNLPGFGVKRKKSKFWNPDDPNSKFIRDDFQA